MTLNKTDQLADKLELFQNDVKNFKNEYDSNTKQRDTEYQLLVQTVQDLNFALSTVETDLKELQKRSELTETQKAKLAFGQMCTQLTTQMYKIIFPQTRSQRTYTLADLHCKIDKVADQSQKEAKEKQLNELLVAVGWRTSMEEDLANLKCGYMLRPLPTRHPASKELPDIRDVIKLLVDVGELDADDVCICLELVAVWERVTDMKRKLEAGFQL